MPTDFKISYDGYTRGGTLRIPDDFGPKQSLRGFEETYRNIVDYIVRITFRIWEDRDVDYISKSYAADSLVFDDYGLQRGNAKIIADTHHTTGAFSDIVLNAKDCIWAGDDEIGFHTSHSLTIAGTNDGPSKYGPAGGSKTDYLCIANCVVLENEIFLEHVLYNTAAMLSQLGIDPWQEAKRLAEDPMPGWPRDAETWNALRYEGSPEKPLANSEPIDGFDPDGFARKVLTQLWQDGNSPTDLAGFSENFEFEGPTLRAFSGLGEYSQLIADIRDACSDFQFQVDEVYWMGNDAEGYSIASRWSAEARHANDGIWGEGSGASLQIWGITQHTVRDGLIIREATLLNEFDVMIQICAARLTGG
jgi:hypothetical protein